MFERARLPRLNRTGISWFAFCILLLCPGTGLAQTWRWAVEDVDTSGGNAPQPSIIADKDGNLHLAYNSAGELHYAFRSAADSRWYKTTLDQHVVAFSP